MKHSEKTQRRLRKFGYKLCILKNSTMFRVKILKSEHYHFENRIARNIINFNNEVLKTL